ncbi:hypothetical protein EDC04DRAFT_3143322 [Pisolithus marmoratus]|nr:hypothetical protein EDC04DRAFT_3143322 [Pisolithus marmoratus]
MKKAQAHAKPVSPMSQVLQSIGLTRDDLQRRSDQMRQFLTTDDVNSVHALSPDMQAAVAPVTGGPMKARSHSRSLSRPSASAVSQTPPPSTPIKSEPVEPAMPLRHMDSMEMILERKSRQVKRGKRVKKEKERSAPSPSPASAGFSLDAFMQSRDARRVSHTEQPGPSTSATSQETLQGTLSPPPVTPQHRKYYRDYDTVEPPSSRPKKHTLSPEFLSPTPTRSRAPSVSNPDQNTTAEQSGLNIVTPRRNNYYKSPLPSSSPPQSSPFATPSAKRIVNLVSSPGPMGPLPDEDEYDNLPYKLPPGPYSTTKPDLSYAALIGQAILSSPDHRLTLQEIYDWITIVYPYFNRNETTWMNSIRHVLSTTVCFRKATRDRTLGRTQWAIWDCDLECFANGNFRKEFCAELREAAKKAPPKKRHADSSASSRKSKRQKKGGTTFDSSPPAVPTAFPPQQHPHPPFATLPQFLPLFPALMPGQHQPYYDNCTQLPAEVIFPPLPPSSNYVRVVNGSVSSPPLSAARSSDIPQSSPSPQPSSLPALTPNCSSSSPPIPLEDNPQTDITMEVNKELTPPPELGPTLAIKYPSIKEQKQTAAPNKTQLKKSLPVLPMPESPTIDRRARSKRHAKRSARPPVPMSSTEPRPSTPPSRPSTPRNRCPGATVQLSPVRTPLSHKGLHMSPSASLAHYKSHLDPPPPPAFRQDDGINPAVYTEEVGVPPPSSSSESPFRTPGSRSIFDPHDPSALLDEEFARLGAKGTQDSPVGLFEGRRGLLYESPSVPSPGKFPRWF